MYFSLIIYYCSVRATANKDTVKMLEDQLMMASILYFRISNTHSDVRWLISENIAHKMWFFILKNDFYMKIFWI